MVERGLKFLQKEAFRWKGAKGCEECHHAGMPLWSMNEDKARGYEVDEKAWVEMTAWTFENTKTNVLAEQAPPRDVINLGSVYTLLSSETFTASKT